jgi:hypothetical protein
MEVFTGLYNMYLYSGNIYIYTNYAVNTYNCCTTVKGVYDMTKSVSSLFTQKLYTSNILLIHESNEENEENDWLIIEK